MVFTSTDSTNYESATKQVLITVSKAVPTLVWETPAAVVFGTELSEN